MIGTFDQRVSLQRKSKTDDGAGGAVTTWTTLAEVWAHVRAMTGREREVSMRNEARANYVVTIRRRDGLTHIDRIVWQGRHLNVRFIKDEGPRVHTLKIEAEMGAAS